jgi:spore coat protein U-like protein
LIWGDGTGGTSTVFLKNVKKNRPVNTTIYAIVPPQQNVSIGTYSDILTVTITP